MLRYVIINSIAAALFAGAAVAQTIGDVEKGEKSFQKNCASCHMVGPNARDRVGPQLNGIFGRKAASVEGFKYSKAMKRAGADGLEWTFDTLDIYIENPKSLVTGTRMSFRGLKDAQGRADVMAYLRQYSDLPSNIPEAEPSAKGLDHDIDPAILALSGDPEYGEYLSSECTTCHQTDGSDKGIPSITLWPIEDFVVAMHAYKDKKRPHPVMQMMAGRLSNEEIAA
ncbi:MAG: c-type cytochrome, partial [Halocynthiibacter sp.]